MVSFTPHGKGRLPILTGEVGWAQELEQTTEKILTLTEPKIPTPWSSSLQGKRQQQESGETMQKVGFQIWIFRQILLRVIDP
jgi:hypothetical protein